MLPFVSPSDLFDIGIVQGPAPGFRVVSLPHTKKFSSAEEGATYATPLREEAVENSIEGEPAVFHLQ